MPSCAIATPAAGEAHGEIEAHGPSVFRGYWHNDAANATAFTDDGWFRTGDLGRFDAGGYLYVVGRNKELIVLPDGKKLFPEPVEKIYAASPLIHELGIFEHQGVLAALVVLEEHTVRERGAMRAASLLREEIENTAARLPPYQRIRTYRVTREALPRTQLGKLKRHLLPALFDEAAHPTHAPTAEPSGADRALLDKERPAKAWEWLREHYPDRKLTLDTSPQLDLQIDSLEWVTLTIEIERRFGVTLTGDALSRILTVRDLLQEIDGGDRVRTASRGDPAVVRTAGPAAARIRLAGARLRAPRRTHGLGRARRGHGTAAGERPIAVHAESHELPRCRHDDCGPAMASAAADVLGGLGRRHVLERASGPHFALGTRVSRRSGPRPHGRDAHGARPAAARPLGRVVSRRLALADG